MAFFSFLVVVGLVVLIVPNGGAGLKERVLPFLFHVGSSSTDGGVRSYTPSKLLSRSMGAKVWPNNFFH